MTPHHHHGLVRDLPRLAEYLASVQVFSFNTSAPTEIYTLSLHDALPIYPRAPGRGPLRLVQGGPDHAHQGAGFGRSEEHTSELQSHVNLVCRLLLEKKKIIASAP